MNYLRNLSVVSFILIIASCTTSKKENTNVYERFPNTFTSLLQTHGGLEKWQSFGTMEYDLLNPQDSSKEHHLISLWNRKDLIVADSFRIGYDGKEVWVAPNKKAYKGNSARFYHNLFFYFLSVPYVLADPNISYEEDTVQLNGVGYPCIKASFANGVGDADKDVYKMIIDPATKKLYGLLYTVTYFSNQAQTKYNFLRYEDWQEANGLQFPGKLVSYKFVNDSIKEKRFEFAFKNIQLKAEAPDEKMFTMPTLAEIDSLIKR
jgi:hypothetical protein